MNIDTKLKLEKFTPMVNNTDIYLSKESNKEGSDYRIAFAFYSDNGDSTNSYRYAFYAPNSEFLFKYENPFITELRYKMCLSSVLPHQFTTIKGLIERCSEKNNSDNFKNTLSAYRLIFWLLFATAIDDEFYDNKLSAIIDLAYCLGFNEYMISDWCKAIEYVLSGNLLSEDCDLVCESEEGKQFFHK